MATLGRSKKKIPKLFFINPLNPELNPICHMLALLGAHLILHISRIRVNIPFKCFVIFEA